MILTNKTYVRERIGDILGRNSEVIIDGVVVRGTRRPVTKVVNAVMRNRSVVVDGVAVTLTDSGDVHAGGQN